jgi:hypothetical protein
MRTDDAIAVAHENRLAPQRAVKVVVSSCKGARGKPIAGEADALFGRNGTAVHPDTVSDIHSCLVDHGVAFARVTYAVRDDGSRSDPIVKYWPIQWVRWDGYERCFKTQNDAGGEVPIVHGDGSWIVFQKHEHEPFKRGALLSAALVWARHAFGIRDWAKGSTAHGNAKVIGEMPAGVALQTAEGASTPEAAAFVALLRGIASADTPVGIKPAGSTVDYLTNNSTAWQVWKELTLNAEKAAARIYLGTDGTLGSQGGAPGVDVQAMFGVAATIVEGDLHCIERGFQTGLIDPWCAINFGTSALAPSWTYALPDADAEALKASFSTRNAAFLADMKAAKEAGIDLSEDYVATLAAAHGVPVPSMIKAATAAAPAAPLRAVADAAAE